MQDRAVIHDFKRPLRDWLHWSGREIDKEATRRVPARGFKLAGIAFLVVAGLALLTAGLLRTPLFGLDRIGVVGNSAISTEDVIRASGLHTGMPLISVDERNAQRRLQAVPSLASAKVVSKWPHTVSIEVVERKPVALVQTTDAKWAQVDASGVVISVSATPSAGLPAPLDVQVSGAPGAVVDRSAMDLIRIAAALPDSMRPHVTQMQRDSAGNFRLGLDSGTIVELGDASDLANELMAAAAVLSHTDPKTIADLDVRSPHLPLSTPVTPASGVVSSATAQSQVAPNANAAANGSTTKTAAETTATKSSQSKNSKATSSTTTTAIRKSTATTVLSGKTQ